MELLRTWTFEGEYPCTISLYKPVMTIRCGNGPESRLSPKQVTQLSERLVDVEEFYAHDNPELL